MQILAIDTSSSQGLVALKTNTAKIYSRKNEKQLEHNLFLLPAVQALLAQAKLDLADIDYFAAGRGPGSFVGTRLAVAVVQGLAFGTQKPVVGTSHLALMAAASRPDITIRLDAKMQGYYQARYKNGQLLGEEEFQRFQDQPPEFTATPVLTGEHLIALAEREIAAGRIFTDPALLQPVYLQDEGNWKKAENKVRSS